MRRAKSANPGNGGLTVGSRNNAAFPTDLAFDSDGLLPRVALRLQIRLEGGLRRIDRCQESAKLDVRSMKPIRAPDPVKPPTLGFQNLLPQTIALARPKSS